MIRATLLRALVLTAALAAALTPCLGQNLGQSPAQSPDRGGKPAKSPPKLPAKATKPLPPELVSLLRQKKMPIHSPILVRIFKEEAELEVWKQTKGPQPTHEKRVSGGSPTQGAVQTSPQPI